MVITLLWFSTAFQDGAIGVACVDFQMGVNGLRLLVFPPSGVSREVDDICILEISHSSGFDPLPSSVAYTPSLGVDWAWAETAQRLYPLQFSSG